jgi:hypothetical protein
MNTALEYSTRVVQEGGRRCKKSTLNDLVHLSLTPLRIPLMNPPNALTYIFWRDLGICKGEGCPQISSAYHKFSHMQTFRKCGT